MFPRSTVTTEDRWPLPLHNSFVFSHMHVGREDGHWEAPLDLPYGWFGIESSHPQRLNNALRTICVRTSVDRRSVSMAISLRFSSKLVRTQRCRFIQDPSAEYVRATALSMRLRLSSGLTATEQPEKRETEQFSLSGNQAIRSTKIVQNKIIENAITSES